MPGRLVRLGWRAGRLYIDRAGEELTIALGNVVASMVLAAVALGFGIFALGFAHVLLFSLAVEVGFSVWQVSAIFLGVDVLMTLVLALVARSMARRPLLPETRRTLYYLSEVVKGD